VEILLEFFTKGLITMLMIAMPCVLTAAAVGLVVGILQAVTQVQEQTIAAAPKIFAVFLVIIMFGAGYLKMLQNVFIEGSNIAFEIIPKSEETVLPPGYYNYTKPFIDEMKTDMKYDMTPLSSILNNQKTPAAKETDKFNFFKNQSKDIPYPDLNERRTIRENKR